MNKKRAALIVAFLAFGLIVGGLVYGAMSHQEICVLCHAKSFSPEVIRHYIEGFGSWAILVYMILYTVNTMTIIPPIAIMSLSAGALFGPIWGTVALSLGAFGGTSVTFLISRFLGDKFVNKFVKGKAAEFNDKLSKKGFVVLLPIRLIGFPPYEFVNYASGLSKITYKDYISATMLGMAPAIFIQVLLADRLANFSWKDPVLYVAVLLFVGMGVLTGKIIKKQQAEDRQASGASSGE